jgi:hypothetical protein
MLICGLFFSSALMDLLILKALKTRIAVSERTESCGAMCRTAQIMEREMAGGEARNGLRCSSDEGIAKRHRVGQARPAAAGLVSRQCRG